MYEGILLEPALKRAAYGQSGLGAVLVVNPRRRFGGSVPRGLGANVEGKGQMA